MYGIVLAVAMSGTPDVASFGGRGCNGCNGCHGCYGAVASCYGGSACHGCNGGGFFSKHRGGCNGCYGGYACNGCHGGYACNGCHGGGLFSKFRNRGCHGCNGCHGGYACHGGSACYGGMACHGGSPYGYGCTGGMYHGGMVTGAGCVGGVIVNPIPGTITPVIEMKKDDMKKDDKPVGMGMTAAPAKIVVSLPADAVLTFDGHKTASTSDSRLFVTPVLNEGQTFTYTLAAEIVRDGATKTASRTVTVRGGESVTVDMAADLFVTAVASK